MNGQKFNGNLLGGTAASRRFEMTEMLYRSMMRDVINQVQNGAGLPIVDPCGNLALVLVLDKLNEIGERLDKLEAKESQRPSAVGITIPHE